MNQEPLRSATTGRIGARDRPTPAKAWSRALERTTFLSGATDRTLPSLMDELAARFGEAPALLSGDEALSYAGLAGRANRYTRWALEQGVRPGEVVALFMHNCPDYAALWLGITRVGGVVALINTNLREAGLEHVLAVASPRHVIAGADLVAQVVAIRPRLAAGTRIWAPAGGEAAAGRWCVLDHGAYGGDPLAADIARVTTRDTALLIYTSGTTGLPKAVKFSHYRILEWSYWFSGMMDVRPEDLLFNCLPMYHSTGGVVGIGAMLVSGGSVLIRQRFSASRFWKDVGGHGCTLFLYIGELCRYLLATADNPAARGHQLRLCFGNGLRKEVWETFQAQFRIPHIVEFYASTEGNVALYNCEGRPGAIGRVPPFLAHRFPVMVIRSDPETGEPCRDEAGRCIRCSVDETGEAIGRILVGDDAGARRFEGYTDAAATERKILRDVFAAGDAWFRTGDLLRRDEAGFFHFVDRIGDTFRWKGENVSTSEVAEVISACPGISGAVVYGVEVPGAEGRAGMAAITTAPDFSLERLHAHLARCLPDYARILFLRICATLEATATFKPVKTRLAAEGFAVNADAEPVYFNDPASRMFVPLDAALRARLLQGSVRL